MDNIKSTRNISFFPLLGGGGIGGKIIKYFAAGKNKSCAEYTPLKYIFTESNSILMFDSVKF